MQLVQGVVQHYVWGDPNVIPRLLHLEPDGRPYAEARAAQMSVRDLDGKLLGRWGTDDPCAPGSFASPHGICLDSRGDLYVGEVAHTALSRVGRWTPTCHSLQKVVRV